MIKKTKKHLDWLSKNDSGKQLDIENMAITDLNIVKEDISAAICTKIDFENITFKDSNLGGSYFYNCIFHHVNFTDTILRKSEFYDCEFYDCNFKNVDLTKAEFNNTIFKNCSVIDSDLGWSFFNKSKLEQLTITSTSLKSTMFNNSFIIDIRTCRLIFSEKYPMRVMIDKSIKEIRNADEFAKWLKYEYV
ncbi:MAG: pentapeptide repeat-containing protein [Campylobacteraceae bacterium]|jgi:uncharacterized protein YjbI with pentapeptide repeats|nr:pentapeptide repeat-containing protein [Campylobacteraceae bacterium]